MPVGGVKLKVQAATSAGIQKIYVPEGCREDIVTEHFENVEIRFVKDIHEVLNEVFPSLTKRTPDVVKKVS